MNWKSIGYRRTKSNTVGITFTWMNFFFQSRMPLSQTALSTSWLTLKWTPSWLTVNEKATAAWASAILGPLGWGCGGVRQRGPRGELRASRGMSRGYHNGRDTWLCRDMRYKDRDTYVIMAIEWLNNGLIGGVITILKSEAE